MARKATNENIRLRYVVCVNRTQICDTCPMAEVTIVCFNTRFIIVIGSQNLEGLVWIVMPVIFKITSKTQIKSATATEI